MTTKHHMTIIDDAELRLKDVQMPTYYLSYQQSILKNVQKSFELAAKARTLGLDVSDGVEPRFS
jgi:DNA polymerase II large subunit